MGGSSSCSASSQPCADVDTIGAMAGAVWGAANGARWLPEELLAQLEQAERVDTAASALHARHCGEARAPAP
jgi:ADP-ribosylglycohydrolase